MTPEPNDTDNEQHNAETDGQPETTEEQTPEEGAVAVDDFPSPTERDDPHADPEVDAAPDADPVAEDDEYAGDEAPPATEAERQQREKEAALEAEREFAEATGQEHLYSDNPGKNPDHDADPANLPDEMRDDLDEEGGLGGHAIDDVAEQMVDHAAKEAAGVSDDDDDPAERLKERVEQNTAGGEKGAQPANDTAPAAQVDESEIPDEANAAAEQAMQDMAQSGQDLLDSVKADVPDDFDYEDQTADVSARETMAINVPGLKTTSGQPYRVKLSEPDESKLQSMLTTLRGLQDEQMDDTERMDAMLMALSDAAVEEPAGFGAIIIDVPPFPKQFFAGVCAEYLGLNDILDFQDVPVDGQSPQTANSQ